MIALGKVLRPYVFAIAIVVGATVVAWAVQGAFATTRPAIIHLAAVTLVALRWGARPALFAAVIAALASSLVFLHPNLIWSWPRAEELVNFYVFLIVALMTAGLSGYARDAAVGLGAREQAARRMIKVSAELSSISDEQSLRRRIAEHIADAAGGRAIFIAHDGQVERAGDEGAGSLAGEAAIIALLRDRMSAADSPDPGVPNRDWGVRILRQEGALAAAAWRRQGATRSERSEKDVFINVLLELGSAAIARAHLSKATADADVARKGERFLNALLSSVSHDFRTPLTTILASASSLLEYGDQFDKLVQRELLTNIQQETQRLNLYVANLLGLSRLEAGGFELLTRDVIAQDVVDPLFRHIDKSHPGRLRLDIEPVTVHADVGLLQQALENVVGNALRFAPESTPVRVAVKQGDGQVLIEVEDCGPGVSPEHAPHLFEKFYRAAPTSRLSGTGLGLFIARSFLEAMGGTIEAGARSDGGPGLKVTLAVPVGRP